MPRYEVIITETFQKVVAVAAASEAEALQRVNDAWMNAEVILSKDDYQGVEVFVKGEAMGDLDKVAGKE